jgi:hypothetical protein
MNLVTFFLDLVYLFVGRLFVVAIFFGFASSEIGKNKNNNISKHGVRDVDN